MSLAFLFGAVCEFTCPSSCLRDAFASGPPLKRHECRPRGAAADMFVSGGVNQKYCVRFASKYLNFLKNAVVARILNSVYILKPSFCMKLMMYVYFFV